MFVSVFILKILNECFTSKIRLRRLQVTMFIDTHVNDPPSCAHCGAIFILLVPAFPTREPFYHCSAGGGVGPRPGQHVRCPHREMHQIRFKPEWQNNSIFGCSPPSPAPIKRRQSRHQPGSIHAFATILFLGEESISRPALACLRGSAVW